MSDSHTTVIEVVAALTALEKEIDVLLNMTPVNADQAWREFQKGNYSAVPELVSRPLSFDPNSVKRRLSAIATTGVGDPTLKELLDEKQLEIERHVELLESRDTSRFRSGSLQLFGKVNRELVTQAEALLETVHVQTQPEGHVSARGFARRAQEEFDFYSSHYQGFDSGAEIRSDVPDLMVRHGRLLIGESASFRVGRVEALIQHEVGTHVVTYVNGSVQPLQLLAVGFPGYEETQEGLAVLAEFAVGGLDAHRLRLLAGRVVAVNLMLEDADFLRIFEELRDRYSFSPRIAWAITIRVTRSGGLSKDVIYLRGISRVLKFAAERGELSPLLVGKLSLDHVALIDELLEKGELDPPWITPRWLQNPESQERLARAYEGMSVLDLAEAT